MNELQDIIGSMVFGGIILVMVVGFNGTITQSAALQTFHTNVQSNLTTVTNILETDLRLSGYRITDSNKVSFADTSKIVFKGDFDDNGTVDSITYYLGTTVPPGVINPRARILYRTLNTRGAQQMNVGITKFRLWYYDAQNNATAVPSKVSSMKVAISIESTQPYDTTYSGGYWERTIKPKNLR